MRRSMEDAAMNMTPMIDVVFQLIIFFVTTADMQSKALDTKLKLAMAPHAVAEEKKEIPGRSWWMSGPMAGYPSPARTCRRRFCAVS